jgi:hypothetical protein
VLQEIIKNIAELRSKLRSANVAVMGAQQIANPAIRTAVVASEAAEAQGAGKEVVSVGAGSGKQ